MRPVPHLAGVALAFAACQYALADLIVDVGTHNILPTHSQTFDINVSGGDAIASFDLYLHVGDGTSGPIVTGFDLESGIFAGKHTGQSDNGSDARRIYASITTNDLGPVTGDGRLLRLTLDATGIEPGDYALEIGNVSTMIGTYSSSFLADDLSEVPATLTNGTIRVIPEPATLGLLGLGALLLRRRR